MHRHYQSLAEFMRHPGTNQTGITEFYTETVGLSTMRSYPEVQMLWAGEDLAFELKFDTDPDPIDQSDPGTAQLIPIFRTHDPRATRDRITAAGHPVVREEADEHSRTFFVVGPDRQVTGFEYRHPNSPLPTDAEALRRHTAGTPRLDGISPLSPDLQYLSRIRRTCTDVEEITTFFREALHLDVLEHGPDRSVLSLGDTVVLEVVAGGLAHPPVTDRDRAASAVIVRTDDLDSLVTTAASAGARRVGPEVVYPGIRIQYFADPDGAVVGLLQRGDPGRGIVDELAGVEDIEAARRRHDVTAGLRPIRPGAPRARGGHVVPATTRPR